ncbi:aminoglycoside phosphotransferase family protein [Micromonospora chokoriensis]|uniref:aminoglycoside phosphotransferase family protein n=1 Tax=Micromonospora chokoriensis TaxID=356851 RepID=UPI001E56720B|nr:aminoglycoside phosphotransferase family protein [Micromonospora chokoriensis]
MSGRFSEEAMTAAMRDVAAALDVSAEGARLLQLTNNAVFALPQPGIIIRIARTHQLLDRVTKVVQLGQWFAEIDAPTIRLVHDVEQPVQFGSLAASVWRYVPPQSPAPTVEDLGLVLREFHALDVPSFGLPAWDPVGDARRRLADAEGLDANDRKFLVEWCDRLEPQLIALGRRGEPKLIHGDAHVGNLLRDLSGRAILCDFDATCVGPWQVDLAALAVGEIRFGSKGSHRALTLAYGFDVSSDPSWAYLREARELKMISAAVPLLNTSPLIAAEFTNRLRSIRQKNLTTRWRPFAGIPDQPGPIIRDQQHRRQGT